MADATTISSKDILHAFFPALFIGLAGVFMGALFATVYGDAIGSTNTFFSNVADMSSLGFFVGFVGRMSTIFEKLIA